MINSEKEYKTGVFKTEIDDSDYAFYEACSAPENDFAVLKKMNYNDVQILCNGDSIELINDINNSMIGPDEDDIISNEAIISSCLNKLTEYQKKLKYGEEKKLVGEILEVFHFASKNGKKIYFLW